MTDGKERLQHVHMEACLRQSLLRIRRDGSLQLPVEWRLRLTRTPSKDEVAMLVKFFEMQKQRFASGELDAKLIAGEGSDNVAERAAWTALARAILNLDEMITKG